MFLPIKPICEKKDVLRDGTCLIHIQYCYSSEKRTILNSQLSIPPNYWNKKRLCISDNLPASFGNVNHLNSELDRMIRLTQDIVSYATRNKIEDQGAFVKKTFKPDFDISTLNKLDVSAINEGLQKRKSIKIYTYNWITI